MALERNINQIFDNKLFENCRNLIPRFGLSNKNFTEFKEGGVIFQIGDSSNFVYLVISGDVKIKYRNINRVLIKSNNDFFGNLEITAGTSRFSAAVAMNDCVLYRMDKNTFKKLSSSVARIRANIHEVEKNDLKEDGESRAKPDLPSMLDLNRAPIKLNIFKRKKEEVLENEEIETLLEEEEAKTKSKESEVEQEIPDLDATIEEAKSERPEDESLKKELLGDSEDSINWNFLTIEEPEPEKKEKPAKEEKFEAAKKTETKEKDTVQNEKILVYKLLENHHQELNELRVSLTQKYDSYFQTLTKIIPGITILETCEKITSVFLKYFNSNYANIFLVNEKTSNLELFYPQSANIIYAKFDDGLTGKAAASNRISIIGNPEKDPRYNSTFDKPKDFTKGTIAYIPLSDAENKLVGVMQLAKSTKDFTKENEEALKIFANQAGIALRFALINDESYKHQKLTAFGSTSNFIMEDIKSPIRTIKHYTSLIAKLDIPEQIKKVLVMLSMHANSVLDIMQATFDFSENRSSIKLEKVQFDEIIENILELLSEYTESQNVKLFKKIGNNVTVNIDPRRLYVACFQIIKNSCEAMPKGGKIYVNTELENKNLILKIRDEGIGISKEIKNDVFRAFFSSGKENRSGLGLAIAKYIIELMKGSIGLESTKNKGTTITITLPIVEE